MKYLLPLLLSISAPALDLTEQDKRYHAYMSAHLAGISYGASRAADNDKLTSAALAIAVTLSVGHLKETRDPVYDKQDMEANAFGMVLGLLVPMGFNF